MGRDKSSAGLGAVSRRPCGGRQVAELEFAGNAILQAERLLPVAVRELRGFRLEAGHWPAFERLVPIERELVLDVDLAGLSDREWDDPKKRAKIRALERLGG